jgi:tRNA pseudouridine55 synthase
MARRKKGRDISGWVLIDKPAGITSTSVVNKLRWAFDAKKAGHAGTLDPDATGLLPVALGEATKTIAYLGDVLKAYEFTVRWGISRPRPTMPRARSSRHPICARRRIRS